MKKTIVLFASVLALLAGLALAGVIHLAFIFPKTMAVWADKGRALSAAEQTLANLSNLFQSTGRLLIPALLAAVVGCSVWAVVACKKSA